MSVGYKRGWTGCKSGAFASALQSARSDGLIAQIPPLHIRCTLPQPPIQLDPNRDRQQTGTKMSSRFLVRQGSQTVINPHSRLGKRLAEMRAEEQIREQMRAEEPSPVAEAMCALIVNLLVAATWLGLWVDYDMAENCDKELRLWYDLVLGGMAFGLACDLGVVIAARLESKPLLKMCKVLHNLDQLFELGVMLWGIALAYGKKSDRVGAGGCKVLATWQKVNATFILVVASLAMCMILTGGGEDAEKAEEMYVGAEMTKRMRAQKGHDSREPERARQDLEAPTPRSRGTA